MTTIAALAKERRAPRCALAVMVVLVADGFVGYDWRPVKQLAVACATRRHAGDISRALGWLVAQGYLERRHEPFVGALYRLPQR